MKLIVEPDAGLDPVLSAVKRAKTSLDVLIFRFDRADLFAALAAAVRRGVAVRALIAHTNHGGQKSLRKLELALLAAGVTVSRTADDLARYHGKLIVVDARTLYLLGFNFTWLDIARSRSFAVVTNDRRLVAEAGKLFEADCLRQPYAPGCDRFLVSPLNARPQLAAFIAGARKQLLIYDPKVSDPAMLRLLDERVRAGVDVRIIGSVGSGASGLAVERYPGKRLHVRAIVRDGVRAFVGSQSLRKHELEKRREIGVIVDDTRVVRGILDVFEQDWALTPSGRRVRESADAASRAAGADSTRQGKGRTSRRDTGRSDVAAARASA